MRVAPLITGSALVALFSACNAILGNESNYELVGSAGTRGGSTGGTAGAAVGGRGGAAGRAANAAGGSSGEAGAAGEVNAAGGKGGGTAGRGGNNATGGTGDGGDGDSGGTTGEAGAPACVATGAENCFNRLDDDCNGDVDCEDSACSGPAECRSAPSGTEFGYFAVAGSPCTTGYTELSLHQGLQVPTQCTGCSCVNPTDLLCDAGIYRHGAYPCPSYQFDGQLYNVFNDRCTTFPGDTNLHYYSIRGTSQCTPSGTPALDQVSWAESAVFCVADRVGGGCGAGMACLPVEVHDNLCTLGSGACGGDYGVDRGNWYEGVDDQRGCTDCSCGLGTADCSASYIGLYSDGACSTNAMALGSGNEGDGCSLPFAGQSARIIGNPVAGSGSCEVNSFMTGEATPTNGHQACCAQ